MKKLLATLLALTLTLTFAPTSLAYKDADDIAYPVEGGNIYFDKSTGEITDADETVTSANIPATIDGVAVQTIGDDAFVSCASLTSVTIPASATIDNMNNGQNPFSGCTSLTNITVSDGNPYLMVRDGVLFTIDGKTLIAYPAGKQDKSYSVPDGVTEIRYEAFRYSASLTNVSIPSSVTFIGSQAFANCSSLTGISIPDSVTSLGLFVFHDCTSLANVTISNSITDIPECTFENCTSLTSVIIPDGVTEIHSNAFVGCTSLSNVTIPNSVTVINAYAFSYTAITDITIPDSVTAMGGGAFANTPITSITIPDNVTEIVANPFYNCPNLTEIVVSSGNSSFAVNDGVLTSIDGKTLVSHVEGNAGKSCFIPDGVTEIGGDAFRGCPYLTSVVIPDGITEIGYMSFCYCPSMTSVEIPDSVTKIGMYAFEACNSLASVTIPASVTEIESGAFEDCRSLTDIYFGGTEEQWAANGSAHAYYAANVTVHYNSDGPSFSDVDPNGPYSDAIVWAAKNGFAQNASPTEFGAEAPCPRWEVISILWKALGSPTPTITSVPFTDIDEDAPYYTAVLWAYENNIAKGNSPTTFGPNDTVMRRDAMTFIYRAAGEPAVSAATSFNDVPAGEYYSNPIAWAASNGIANGTGNNNFSPDAPVTRAQMVTFLYRWLVENA